MTITGLLMLASGFFGGLLACKYQITDFDSSMKRIKRIYGWLGDRLSRNKNDKEEDSKQSNETTKDDGK